ncbi:MAG TPA: winged helix-turn-helix domain-containing protein [Burkholderiaceae bacterium]|nr:winged helix-turn-helix domain-containing protein [Burkholderiaceae bacterium]
MDSADGIFRFGRFQLDPVRRVLRVDGTPARLGARAIDVLLVLVRQRDRIVSKDQLLDLVWPGLVVEENNLQVQVSSLRKLLGPEAIATVPGRGYQFVADLDDDRPNATAARPAREATVSLPAPRTALPANLPLLIGREVDLAEVRAVLATHALVTLTGPGGIGKTRLALAVAQAELSRHADGVRLVDLAAVTDRARVSAAVASALGIELPPGQSAASTIAGALREQSLLVLLDNCEHVLDEVAALVDTILRRAPRVHLLATSQAPLRVAGEQVMRLAPLALPPATDPVSLAHVERYGALQLFVARARSAQRGFELKAETLATAVEICRRLDGIPLAIELAAARLPLLGLTGLRDRLDERLRVLTAGAREAPARQQTLRATLEWSHSLLELDEQVLFRRLGVFVSGFSLSLAQRVVVDADSDPWSMIDRLGTLVERSLVVAEGEGVPRYHLLESARVYALEQLEASGEVEAIERRHAEAMQALVEDFDAAIAHAPRFDVLVQAIEPEMDNLRAALRWAMSTPAARPIALALLAASNALWVELDPFGDAIGHYQTARNWLDASVPAPLEARFRLAYQAMARIRLLSPVEWRDSAWRALELYRTLDDRVGLYKALCGLGGAPREVIDESQAAALLAEAERIEDPAWSPRQRARRQLALEWFHDLGGRFEACREAGLAHVALARQAGALGAIPALSNLADTEFVLGHHDVAIALCREAIRTAAAIGRPATAVHAYGNMVPALLERGQLDEAEAAIRDGRALLMRGLGTAFVLLLSVALLAERRGQAELAAGVLGCADRTYAEGGHHLHPPERRIRAALLPALDARLGEQRLAALMQEGARWSESDAFERAGFV